jgi:hypothetical protein
MSQLRRPLGAASPMGQPLEAAFTASVMRMPRILLVFIQPPGRKSAFGLWKIWAQSLPTDVLIVEIVSVAGTEMSWRPLASRRRLNKL